MGTPVKTILGCFAMETNKPFPVAQRPGFPGWSWTGWFHRIDGTASRTNFQSYDIYDGADEEYTNQSALVCWTISEDPGTLQIETYSLNVVM
jgi:hypothetical protein